MSGEDLLESRSLNSSREEQRRSKIVPNFCGACTQKGVVPTIVLGTMNSLRCVNNEASELHQPNRGHGAKQSVQVE